LAASIHLHQRELQLLDSRLDAGAAHVHLDRGNAIWRQSSDNALPVCNVDPETLPANEHALE
jgi:hypothetical protein